MQLCSSLNIVWHCLSLEWNENWPFPVLCPLLSFPNLLAYWVQTLTASSFRMWNSSPGIPSPPLALFIVILPKADLTSHSRMSGSWWLITPLWLFGSLSSFLYMNLFKLMFSFSSDIYPHVELLNHMVVSFLVSEETPYCFPQWFYQFTFPPTVYKGCISLHPCQHLLFMFFLIAILTGVGWCLTVISICISLMIRDTEHFSWACLPSVSLSLLILESYFLIVWI